MNNSETNHLVYILVLNWQGGRETIRCLDSLQGLEYPNYRLLVIDNGSADDSVARISEAYPDQVILQTGKNLGFAGGNNSGIRHAMEQGAEFIWLLNNDTTVDAKALSELIGLAQSRPKTGAVGSVVYSLNEPNRILAFGGGRLNFLGGISRHYTSPVPEEGPDFLTGASLLLRVTALREVGLLDENFFLYWEDADLCLRLSKGGWQLRVAESSIVWHEESASTGKSPTSLDFHFNASAVRFFRLHSSIPVVPIVIGTGGRLIKRVLKREWSRLSAAWKGAKSGYLSQLRFEK